jgi:iron complex transport system permease protein
MAPDPSVREAYRAFTRRKLTVTAVLILSTAVAALYAIQAGAADLSIREVIETLLGKGSGMAETIVWNIRLPRVLGAIVAGMGLALSGAVMQNVMRNPLASPFTLGISQGAAFGAAFAIIALGGGTIGSSTADAVKVTNVFSVTVCAFAGAMLATLVVVGFARFREATPETMVLIGVALGSLFSAGTVLLQYFADDTQVAAVVFWTFGDLGRVSWRDLGVMALITLAGSAYFIYHSWSYNTLEGGAETAEGLGVDVRRVRMRGMFVASFVTSVAVAFMGIIGFIGLVGPHLVRRLIGNDHRFVLPASAAAGALLLLSADTLARIAISPVILPVGAITALLGAPLFLYLLMSGGKTR